MTNFTEAWLGQLMQWGLGQNTNTRMAFTRPTLHLHRDLVLGNLALGHETWAC